jgi:hypothetical protein
MTLRLIPHKRKGCAMCRKITTVLILGLMLFSSGCATYQDNTGTHYASPPNCQLLCPLLFIGAFAGIGAAVAHH